MKRGEVYYVNLFSSIGSEQEKCRPCVIVQNDYGNAFSGTTIIAPMTTRKKKRLPTHVRVSPDDRGLHSETIILLEQVRVVDKQRVGDYICRLCSETMERVDKAIKISLALNKKERGDKKLNELKVFENPEFGSVRMLEIKGEPWFVGKDVAEILKYQNASKALSDHVDEEDKLNNESLSSLGQRGGWLINESGVYSLIFGSKLPSAKRFKHWVTSEVLPSIRKTGGYQQKRMTPEEMMRVQLGMIDGHEERIKALEDTMTIDHGQQRVLERTVNKTVIDTLGGKQSNAYREMSRKVFAECNRDLKNHFNVNSRDDVPRKDYEQAIEYAKSWRPSTNTMLMIRGCNAQMTI